MIVHLAATQLFDAQVATSSAAAAGAWTPVSTAAHLIFGQYLKRSRFIRNRWLDQLLPLIGMIGFVVILLLARYLDYSVHPLSGFALLSSHFGGAVGSKIVYNGTKVPDPDQPGQAGFLTKIPSIGPIIANSLTPGEDNHPADAADAAAKIVPPIAPVAPPPPPSPAFPPPPPPINPFAPH